MKIFLLVCEGMADDPLPELGNRTPLEVAKTPHLDELAKNGRVGNAAFLPHSLAAGSDVAMLSMLGYDPLEFYTGIAPLEARALDVPFGDRDVVFRSDFVTVSDETMVDPAAGRVPAREAGILLEALKARLESGHYKFYPADGYKNLMVVHDADKPEEWADMECPPPSAAVGQKASSWFPKGKKQGALIDLMKTSKALLDPHEINRVRIDLKENPANQLWFWGQGAKPKLPAFKQRYGLNGSVRCSALFMKGLAKILGLTVAGPGQASSAEDLELVYDGFEDDVLANDLKAKIRRLEEFDAKIVGPARAAAAKADGPFRIAAVSNVVHSLVKKGNTHAHAPFLIAGAGIEGGGCAAFTEKNCGQSGVVLASGSAFLNELLKK